MLVGAVLLFLGVTWVEMAIHDRLNYTVRGVNGEWRGMLVWGSGMFLLSLLVLAFAILRIRRLVQRKRSASIGNTLSS